MRKLLITAAALAALLAAPTVASAQSVFTGAVIGAGTGALVAGPVGAVVGGTIGAGIGASTEPRVYVEERTYVAPYGPRHRQCWRDEWGRRFCR